MDPIYKIFVISQDRYVTAYEGQARGGQDTIFSSLEEARRLANTLSGKYLDLDSLEVHQLKDGSIEARWPI